MNKTILLLLFVSAGILNIYPQGIAEVSIPFQVYDNAGGEKTLFFGVDTTASDTIDFHLGESNLPPVPPAGAFDARWILPKNDFSGTLSSWLDYRNTPGFPFTDTLEHRLKYQAKTGADTLFFTWNFPTEVTGLLQDLITGTLVNQPLSDSGIFALTNFAVLNQLKLTLYYDAILPVELSSFSASLFGQSVLLNWITASEINNAGFEIERSQKSKVKSQTEWERIGFVEGNGTTTETNSYLFIDPLDGTGNNITTGTYVYRLKQIDFDGSFNYSNEIEIEVGLTPAAFALEQNYPNPFNPNTTIKYSLPFESEVKLVIHNVLGEIVTELVNGNQSGGNYEITWNAGNLSSGVYFYTIQAMSVKNGNQFKSVKKMILLR